MSFLRTNSVKIICEGVEYDSLSDLKLAIENTDYIGDPVVDESCFISVPGRSGLLDTTDAVYGGPVYQYRPISIKFGGIDQAENWDERISRIRNLFEWKTVRIEFKTVPGWYFTGRVRINEFNRKRGLARFEFNIPYADPFRHRDKEKNIIALASGISVNCENGGAIKITPTVFADKNIQIIKDGVEYGFDAGTHLNSAFKFVPGDNILTITGNNANVVINYTEGRL